MSFIENYIDKLTINNVNDFAVKNNIYLNTDELDIIYRYIKNDYKTIINNPSSLFSDLQNKISKNNYSKILKLYKEYTQKYQNYL